MAKWFNRGQERINEEKVVYVPLSRIVRSPFLPRRNFADEEIFDLAQSILALGVIQPVILRKRGDLYQLIAGERRYRACLLLGLAQIPALVRDMDDEKAACIALAENLQRKPLDLGEESRAYNRLGEVWGLKPHDIEAKTGKKEREIAHRLEFMKLVPEVQKRITETGLDEHYVSLLLQFKSPVVQLEIIDEIMKRNLSLAETKDLVERWLADSPFLAAKGDKKGEVMVIRDERIFLNTIKETVRRARQTGIDIYMDECDTEDGCQIVIKVAKKKPYWRRIAR
ncbi:chromosome partitioning protein, ParB family [Thermosyntropha lipolytica DSM 11003]|uniref:Chromosome partitioning protein, ParB family n=1 Tax=Thermosyntropha lipolytica DSM 11003 TaxID=1123382 RepID=A0A1M5QRN0_9FIRM|nr:ParB/RepB/Spo0J family partition protein [Thermosyntropha lipolytica]SHH16531.1 chromosome partitioning protein, ParB family [Thermosyntropha lipolytica DSM 11003]